MALRGQSSRDDVAQPDKGGWPTQQSLDAGYQVETTSIKAVLIFAAILVVGVVAVHILVLVMIGWFHVDDPDPATRIATDVPLPSQMAPAVRHWEDERTDAAAYRVRESQRLYDSRTPIDDAMRMLAEQNRTLNPPPPVRTQPPGDTDAAEEPSSDARPGTSDPEFEISGFLPGVRA